MNINEQARQSAGQSDPNTGFHKMRDANPGAVIGSGIIGAAREMPAGTTEGLRSRAQGHAWTAAQDAARHERLAEKLTPEIETVLWCWQECLALGLIDIRVIADAAAREERRQRDRF